MYRLSWNFIWIVLGVLAGCGETPSTQESNVDSGVYGTWSGTRVVDSIEHRYLFKIEKDKVTQSTECHFRDGTVLTSSVTVAASIDDKVIHILEAKSDVSGTASKYCGVTLTPRKISYRFDSHNLTVTNLNQGLTDKLTKL